MTVIEETKLSVRVRLADGQGISFWVWDEKSRKRARSWAEYLCTQIEGD